CRSYTYWNRAEQGPPSLRAMKAASAVIYFTGANLRGLAAENQDPESALPPLTSADDSLLQQYVDSGGHLFVTGMGAAQSGGFDPYFTAAALGGVPSSLSVYDSKTNDTEQKGGISPPRPSAKFVQAKNIPAGTGLFAGMKPVDVSTQGDG